MVDQFKTSYYIHTETFSTPSLFLLKPHAGWLLLQAKAKVVSQKVNNKMKYHMINSNTMV
jgi:hypothetical protein